MNKPLTMKKKSMNNRALSINKKIVFMFGLFAVFLLLSTAIIHAEDDDHERENIRERDDDYDDDRYESAESTTQEHTDDQYSVEGDDYDEDADTTYYEDDDYDEDDDWDMTNDFVYDTIIVEEPLVESVIITPAIEAVTPIVPVAVMAPLGVVPTPSAIAVNLSDYNDDDNDTILNKYDHYPGIDDLMMIDTDTDTVPDRMDLYPGLDDRDFVDSDHDGIVDSNDSDSTRNTDKDHDGVDDSTDSQDNRAFFVKFFSMLGLL